MILTTLAPGPRAKPVYFPFPGPTRSPTAHSNASSAWIGMPPHPLPPWLRLPIFQLPAPSDDQSCLVTGCPPTSLLLLELGSIYQDRPTAEYCCFGTGYRYLCYGSVACKLASSKHVSNRPARLGSGSFVKVRLSDSKTKEQISS
jgi:hypothetical protein